MVLVAVALGVAVPDAQAGGRIYSFIDEDGVTHFTDIPRGDKRFQPIKGRLGQRYRGARVPIQSRFDTLIATAARDQRVSPALVKAVIAAESAFDPQAVSGKRTSG